MAYYDLKKVKRMLRVLSVLALLVNLATVIRPAFAQIPPLDQSTFDRYRNAIEPTGDETAFLGINWQSQLSRAVQRAYESEKPLLIYVMNGHPLGCT